LIAITVNVGFLMAKCVTFAVRAGIGEDAMISWGWRIPFLCAFLPGVVAVWGRRGLPESEAFVHQQEQAKRDAVAEASEQGRATADRSSNHQVHAEQSVFSKVLSTYWRNVLVVVFGAASFAILQFGAFVWMQAYLEQQGMPPEGRMRVALVSRVLMIVLGLPVGWLADIKGVGWVTHAGAVLVAFTALPLFGAVYACPTNELVVLAAISVGLSLVGVICMTVYFLFAVELFPVEVRGTGSGFAYNVGFAFFGGLSPTLAQASLKVFPLAPGVIWMAGGVITSFAVLAGLRLERKGEITMAHVRPEPYFHPYFHKGIVRGKATIDDCSECTDQQSEVSAAAS